MLLATSEAVRRIDRVSIERYGVPGAALMETAGRAATEVLLSAFGDRARARGVVVLAGKGNNGGDGFVMARHLASLGIQTRVVLAGAALDDLAGDARVMAKAWTSSHGEVVEQSSAKVSFGMLLDAGVVVDALLGTGISSAPTGAVADAIRALNSFRMARAGVRVLSLDLPSGLDGSTGETPGEVVRADATVTFGLPKLGLFSYPGARFAGRVAVAPLGWPRAAVAAETLLDDTIETSSVKRPRRLDPEAHKGSRGRVVVIAGCDARPGAAALAARGAFRAGAGSVVVVTTPLAGRAVIAAVPEAMTEPLEAAAGEISAAGVGSLARVLATAQAIVIGPGLGLSEGPRAALEAVLAGHGAPAVLDADALTLVAGRGLSSSRALVLTPHPGEMGRLLGRESAAIQAARVRSVREAAAMLGSVVVLKGARSLVAKGEALSVNMTGNPGLGTAGAGDVLAGAIGGLLARGLSAWDAARTGVWAHGAAADIARAAAGGDGFTAGDVAECLPRALGTPGAS